jgi:SAM-dependent methyltransferase
MPEFPDLDDPRYLDELGWFISHEHNLSFSEYTYERERRESSEMLLEEIMEFCGVERTWLSDKTVMSVGCGCTADLSSWPAARKIAIDPLLLVYQELDMLLLDAPGTSQTLYLSTSAENVPLVSRSADLIVLRNALDHMHHPDLALHEMARLLAPAGWLFLDVDLGGRPTPDEPSVFTADSLERMIRRDFHIVTRRDEGRPNSAHRDASMRFLLGKLEQDPIPRLDKAGILSEYLQRHSEEAP